MTEEYFGPPDPLSESAVATAVAAVRPDWELRDAEPIEAGIDVLYCVTVRADDGDRDAVLKCLRGTGPFADRSDADFLAEVRLLEFVAAETSVPVPTVYGTCRSHDDVPSPLYLMEAVGGVNAEAVEGRDRGAFAERLARESGRYLARIHDCRSFDGYGFLSANDGGVAVADPTNSWTEFLRERVTELVDELPDTRFADVQADLATAIDSAVAAVDVAPEPVLEHNDFRHGNLHVDPETGEIAAVLDWGAARAGSRLAELVRVEFDLSNHAPLGSDRHRRIRDALFDAYEDERGLAFERDASFERRRRLYRTLALLAEMRRFSDWYEGMPDDLKTVRADEIRAEVADFLDRSRDVQS